MKVAALYVELGGPYFGMPDVDPWDLERDARAYAGPLPIVAHPPCGPWGRLHHLYRGDEHDCAPAAAAAVRKWGGYSSIPHTRGSGGCVDYRGPASFLTSTADSRSRSISARGATWPGNRRGSTSSECRCRA